MKKETITFKDLTKEQLTSLKEIYLESRIKAMSEAELRKFAREVLELQIEGTVGNEEEKEVWREMQEHFADDFEAKLLEVIKANESQEVTTDPKDEDFQKRLELLAKQKSTQTQKKIDMWSDD